MNAFLRLMAWLLALALVTLPVVAVIRGWVGAERWPLRTVLVNGQLTRVTDAQCIGCLECVAACPSRDALAVRVSLPMPAVRPCDLPVPPVDLDAPVAAFRGGPEELQTAVQGWFAEWSAEGFFRALRS